MTKNYSIVLKKYQYLSIRLRATAFKISKTGQKAIIMNNVLKIIFCWCQDIPQFQEAKNVRCENVHFSKLFQGEIQSILNAVALIPSMFFCLISPILVFI